jgi:hypothetical protein
VAEKMSADALRAHLRAKQEAEIEKEYGESDGISYSTLMNLKSEAKNPLSRMYGTSYGTQLSPGAIQAREAAASGKKYKPGYQEELDSAKAKRAGREAAAEERRETRGMKKGGKVKSASSRADGIAQRGKTRGMMR